MESYASILFIYAGVMVPTVSALISVFPDTISEEEYKKVKNNKDKYPDWYVGLVGFCSFGSKYWGGIEEAMTKKAEPKMKQKV